MKKYQIIFNPSAYQKLDNIFSYIAIESPKMAIKIIDGIETQIMSLTSIPERFPVVPEKVIYKNYQIRHFFYKKSFRVIYAVYDDIVHILDIRHSAQDYISKDDIDPFL
jgi:plasmid stabilization system protein ParE